MSLTQYAIAAISLISLQSKAQAIDNTASYKNINSHHYIRFNYENDFFSATDKYYTQGIHLEFVAPGFRKFPVIKVLPHPNYNLTSYGIALEHDGYTPSDISPATILYGDHPYAACFFLKTFRISVDTSKKQRFSSSLSTGLIGQGAGGKEMQESIHRWTNSLTPHGWSNQINNDLILNYQVNYEKQLLNIPNIFSLDVGAMARIGTLSDKASIATTVILGYFHDPFLSSSIKKSDFRLYAYEHPEVDLVGYDAALQGGMFTKTSPYTIPSSDVSRVVFYNRFGFVAQYRGLHVEYFQAMNSNNFRTGNYHVWGGVQVAVAF